MSWTNTLKKQLKNKMKNIFKVQSEYYITSDEEIKEGYWVFDSTNYGLIHKVWEVTKTHFSFKDSLHARGLKSRNRNLKIHFKKIILTTDSDLIKDGIQSIDDTFLEWFVKNPSCESVEVVLDEISLVISDNIYRIIIPQEQPKTNLEKLPFPELIEELVNYHKDTFLVEEENPIQLFSMEFILGFLEYIEGTYSYSNIFDHWYLHADTSKSFSRKELLKEYQKTILPPNKLDT
jgi:hypothetical protein